MTMIGGSSIIIFLFLGLGTVLIFFLLDSNRRRIDPDKCLSIGSDLAVIPGFTSKSLCSECSSTGCKFPASSLLEAKKYAGNHGCFVFNFDDSKGEVTLLDKIAVNNNTPETNSNIYYFIATS